MDAPGGSSAVRTGLLTTNAGGEVVLRGVLVRSLDDPEMQALLEVGTLVIGSHEDADLRLVGRSVSRFHLELALLGDGVRVRDLGSTNGSFLGELRVESLVVMPPVELRLGKARVELLPADRLPEYPPPEGVAFGHLRGDSMGMRRVFELLSRAAEGAAPVLIEGPVGSGKTAAAQALHAARFAGGAPLVSVDLGAQGAETELRELPPTLRHGSLLLERVDECSAQAATVLLGLLDARERGEVRFSLISTAVQDLRRRVEVGALPRALYFHVAGVRVRLPALVDRLEDLPTLVRALAERCGVPSFTPGVVWLNELSTRAWPGNVRELARALELELAQRLPPSVPPPLPPTPPLASQPFKQAKLSVVEDFERRYVEELLARHDGNLSRAAEEAGIDRGHLSRLAKRHGLR